MAAFILFAICIVMMFGVFPLVLMGYATIRDKKAAAAAEAEAEVKPDAP